MTLLFLRMLVGIAVLTCVAYAGLRALVALRDASDVVLWTVGVLIIVAMYFIARAFGHSDPLDIESWR